MVTHTYRAEMTPETTRRPFIQIRFYITFTRLLGRIIIVRLAAGKRATADDMLLGERANRGSARDERYNLTLALTSLARFSKSLERQSHSPRKFLAAPIKSRGETITTTLLPVYNV